LGELIEAMKETNLMINFWLIAAATLLFGWVTVALAQDKVDLPERRDGIEVQYRGITGYGQTFALSTERKPLHR
jgi:hypothetical protein